MTEGVHLQDQESDPARHQGRGGARFPGAAEPGVDPHSHRDTPEQERAAERTAVQSIKYLVTL